MYFASRLVGRFSRASYDVILALSLLENSVILILLILMPISNLLSNLKYPMMFISDATMRVIILSWASDGA